MSVYFNLWCELCLHEGPGIRMSVGQFDDRDAVASWLAEHEHHHDLHLVHEGRDRRDFPGVEPAWCVRCHRRRVDEAGGTCERCSRAITIEEATS